MNILGMPKKYFRSVILILIAGIIVGSFLDFRINVLLENKTTIGSLFATFGSYFSYCLYPVAGTCLYAGFKKKNNKMLARVLLIVSCFLAVYYTNSYSGSKIRDIFGYVAGESSPIISICTWLLIVAAYIWIPFVIIRLIDDTDPDKLITCGATILIAGVLSDNVNLWLKQVASRPRYKYLITLDEPMSEYRNWWEMIPNLAGNNDSFKSWPSGNMTIAAMMFSLPLLTDSMKKRSQNKNLIAFIIACVFVALYGYNRIHMTNHFLTDVCFGVLITYVIHGAVNIALSPECSPRV